MAQPMSELPTVAVAGATGFVGQALREALRGRYRIVGLTRSPVRAKALAEDPDVEWRYCDLFSLSEVERALEGIDYAFYLVHSMMPSARLVQADFEDLDLILADNFARSAKKNGVRQVLYLGGIIPPKGDLSRHLRSRLEVEQTLMNNHPAVTALRAGLIVGRGGSSFSMLINLVRRLPVMVLPSWTRSESQPIAVQDVMRACVYCIGNEETFGKHFDIGGPEVMTYRTMLSRTASVLGVKRPMLQTPLVSEEVSKGWVSLITGASMELATPLVESLRHRMVVADNPVQRRIRDGLVDFESSLRESLEKSGEPAPNPRRALIPKERSVMKRARAVRSVQRLPLPEKRDASWVAREYVRWLPGFVWPFLRCETSEEGVCGFYVRGTRFKLLELSLSAERSYKGRDLFYITGGFLLRKGALRGRFEFREVLNHRYILAAIHDFTPTLPWHIYNLTQAVAHLWVMRGFGKYLGRIRGKTND
ncbi:MAG: NAD-dependent epimerase/dehydratase family protein [Myxococcota bacterium]